MIKAILIGQGTIGAELRRRLNRPTWDLRYILQSRRYIETVGAGPVLQEHIIIDGDDAFPAMLTEMKGGVVFICIPTRDGGETALKYALAALNAGAYVVTAEKGIAAWQFAHIKPHLSRMDLGAAVGGGNAFLYTMRRRHLRGKRVTLWGVFNATLNNILWQVQGGASLESAVLNASKIGIAEPLKPGEKLKPTTLINGELMDVAMKICAFFNFVFADKEHLLPSKFAGAVVNLVDVTRLISVNDCRRFIVTITNDPTQMDDDDDLIAPMKADIGEYRIRAGFKSIRAGTVIHKWMPGDIDNGILLREDGHTYFYGGPGAGTATVDTMMAGAKELVGID